MCLEEGPTYCKHHGPNCWYYYLFQKVVQRVNEILDVRYLLDTKLAQRKWSLNYQVKHKSQCEPTHEANQPHLGDTDQCTPDGGVVPPQVPPAQGCHQSKWCLWAPPDRHSPMQGTGPGNREEGVGDNFMRSEKL